MTGKLPQQITIKFGIAVSLTMFSIRSLAAPNPANLIQSGYRCMGMMISKQGRG